MTAVVIFGLDDGVAAVAVAVIASVVGPIVVAAISVRTHRTVREEGRRVREQNTRQHATGQRLSAEAYRAVLDLHHKIDRLDEKVDHVVAEVDARFERLEQLDRPS